MHYLSTLMILSAFIQAEQMSSMDHQSIHTYNKRPIVRKSAEKKAHELHKIDERKAREIAEKKCGEKVRRLTLNHSRLYLYYRAETENCTLYINALDGTIFDPETIRKGSAK